MKLAPITIARRAPFADAMIARQSASERNTWTWGWSDARDRQAHRLRPGRQQQTVVGNSFATGENHVSGLGIDRCDLGAEPQIDTRVGVEILGAQRQPVLGRAAGEIVL